MPRQEATAAMPCFLIGGRCGVWGKELGTKTGPLGVRLYRGVQVKSGVSEVWKAVMVEVGRWGSCGKWGGTTRGSKLS